MDSVGCSKRAAELAAIRKAIDYAGINICTHEDTHRGGYIWTICDHCDMKWADDKGGFKPSSWPAMLDEAMDALADLEDTGATAVTAAILVSLLAQGARSDTLETLIHGDPGHLAPGALLKAVGHALSASNNHHAAAISDPSLT